MEEVVEQMRAISKKSGLRMEVETLDHDESPRVTSFRAIHFATTTFGLPTKSDIVQDDLPRVILFRMIYQE